MWSRRPASGLRGRFSNDLFAFTGKPRFTSSPMRRGPRPSLLPWDRCACCICVSKPIDSTLSTESGFFRGVGGAALIKASKFSNCMLVKPTCVANVKSMSSMSSVISPEDAYKCKSWPDSQLQLCLNPVGPYKAGGLPKVLQLQHVPQFHYSELSMRASQRVLEPD